MRYTISIIISGLLLLASIITPNSYEARALIGTTEVIEFLPVEPPKPLVCPTIEAVRLESFAYPGSGDNSDLLRLRYLMNDVVC